MDLSAYPHALPTEFGPYHLEERLGEGGMGSVFLAVDRDSLRHGARVEFAVKVPLAFLLRKDPTLAESMLREARAALSVRHKNIVAVHKVGKVGDIPYLAMERLHGRPVDELLTSGPLAPQEVLRIGREVALGLAIVHSKRLVHRDIKPSNIFCTDDEQVKLLDLGIAKAVDATTRMTGTGLSKGTPGYLAPEQLRPKARLDGQTDLFALGAVLVELALAEPAFFGEDLFQLLDQVRDAESHVGREDLGLRVDAAVPGLGRLVVELLRNEPTARPAGAREVAARLKALMGSPVVAGGRVDRPKEATPTAAQSASATSEPANNARDVPGTSGSTASGQKVSAAETMPTALGSSVPATEALLAGRTVPATEALPTDRLVPATAALPTAGIERTAVLPSSGPLKPTMPLPSDAVEPVPRRRKGIVAALGVGGVVAVIALCGVGGLGVAGAAVAFSDAWMPPYTQNKVTRAQIQEIETSTRPAHVLEAELQDLMDDAGPLLQEVHLARARVARRSGPQHTQIALRAGLASDKPEGLFIAAEVLLVDADRERAEELIRESKGDLSGPLAERADVYLRMLESKNPVLAEAEAQYLLGFEDDAKKAAAEVLGTSEPEFRERWKGRGVEDAQPETGREVALVPPQHDEMPTAVEPVVAGTDSDTESEPATETESETATETASDTRVPRTAAGPTVSTLNDHGWGALDRGDVQTAIDTFQRVRNIAPKDPVGNFGLGYAYLQAEQPGRAKQFLCDAIKYAGPNVTVSREATAIGRRYGITCP